MSLEYGNSIVAMYKAIVLNDSKTKNEIKYENLLFNYPSIVYG